MSARKLILVPTDSSEHSDRAIQKAADIAEENNARLCLLHVVDQMEQCAIGYCISAETMQQIQSDSAKAATRKMQEEARRILRSKKIDVTFDVKVGIPCAEILKEQADRKADLIVIGSHGRTGIARSLIGSVAEMVMRLSKCPVLLVR